MSTGFALRAYQPGDEAAVLALLRQVLGEGGRAFERTEAFWHWKHEANVFGRSILMLATEDEVVGVRAFMRWRFRSAHGLLAAVRAVDTATHPRARRRGVFSTLTRAAVAQAEAAGVDLIFNTPNRLSLPGYLKLGWTRVGRPLLLVRLVRPLRVLAAVRARRTPARPHAYTPGHEVVGRNGASPDIPDDLPHVREWLQAFDVEGLLAEADRLDGEGIRTDRSAAWLRWRYAEAPTLPYQAVWTTDPGPAALVVRTGARGNLREAMLSEVLASPRGVSALGKLVRWVVAAAAPDYLVAHAPWGSVRCRALLRAGFVPLPWVGPVLTVRPLSATARAAGLSRPGAWQLSLGDLEIF
jgi:GNAT superfamily N-acetyltransferase